MAGHNMPYMAAYGNIPKALRGIQAASAPDRFTQDFLETKLGMKGGSPKPVIPFLKKTGFLSSDGTPTAIYKRFRNPTLAGAAAAEALRLGFGPLYEINEYAHDLNEKDLTGVVVQATGLEGASSTVKSIIASFKALRAFANFDASAPTDDDVEIERPNGDVDRNGARPPTAEFRLGYTINLNLPATSDIAVFNAIFKSLREHILGR